MRPMKRPHFKRFEALAQRLVEGRPGLRGGDQVTILYVATQLARALEDSQRQGETANSYEVALHPETLQALRDEEPSLEQRLSSYLQQLCRRRGIALNGEVSVALTIDESLLERQVEIVSSCGSDGGSTTHVFDRQDTVSLDQLTGLDAFLIVNGKRHVALDKPLVTIGRRVDNDVIIDSPIVSRQHAHIRWRYGRFILYDLGSRGGITVNGERTRECVLQAGDLIALSDRIPLIYGEGLENRAELELGSDGGQDTMALPSDREI